MHRGRLGSELRKSAALLRAETWLFVGVGLAWATFGGWVIATGLLLETLGLEGTVFATIDGVAVSLHTVLAAGIWLLVPALGSVVFVNRKLRNSYDNLTDAYRLDHPSLLLAIPGCVLFGCLLLSVVFGQRLPLTVLALVASVHLVVRTVAYGHRVYTLSVPPLLSLLVFVSAVSLGSGWLVQVATAPGALAALSPWLAEAGVGPVAETVLQLTGLQPAQVISACIAVPGVLASVYLLAQLLAGTVVRIRAPLANPQRRPDQRFPIMPPVGGPRDDAETAVVERDVDTEPDSREQTVERSDTADESSDDSPSEHTGTRVFSPDEVAQTRPPAHESAATADQDDIDEDNTAEENAAEGDTDEEWIDDTAVFTPGGRDAGQSYCGNCGESIAGDVTTCPSCGEPVTD